MLKPESGCFWDMLVLCAFSFYNVELILYPFLFLLVQLAYCIVQFLEKDPSLTEPVS